MLIFFLCLTTITSALLSGAFIFAWALPDALWHFYFGLIGTVASLCTHCWVFFYFIGTGEGIREGILENGLDKDHIRTTKKFKGRIFPLAFFSMVFLIVASIMGGALRAGSTSKFSHLGWMAFAIAFNLFTFRKEARIIGENEKLMKELNDEIEIPPSAAGEHPPY